MLIAETSGSSLNKNETVIERGRAVLQIEIEGLDALRDSLDEQFAIACRAILNAKGRIIITGMGKSGHVGRKAAATFSATGTPSFYVHPGEASHGDLGMLVPRDTLIVISNSGNTPELHAFLQHARSIGVKIIGIATRPDSRVMRAADIKVQIPAMREACKSNVAPTTSTTMQLALCDAMAMAVMDMRGFSDTNMSVLHPGGAIGLRFMPVSEIMHVGDSLPLVKPGETMVNVLSTMTRGGFGIAGVVDEKGSMVGVVTDGDVRRNFSILDSATAENVMTPKAKTLGENMTAEAALEVLNDAMISAAFILESNEHGENIPTGIVHIHDFLRIGLS